MNKLEILEKIDRDEINILYKSLDLHNIGGGCVFYCAGAVKNIDFKSRSGFGIHSYFYDTEKPKNTGAFKTEYPTKDGYVLKSKTKKEDVVNITEIYNFYGFNGAKTVEVAELESLIQCLNIILRTNLKDALTKVTILTTSKYVHLGTTNYLSKWMENGFKNKDSTSVKNTDYWKILNILLEEMKATNIDFTLSYIDDHLSYGTVQLAQLSLLGLKQEKELNWKLFTINEYTKSSFDFDPLLLDSKLLYFPERVFINKNGNHIYATFNNNNAMDDNSKIGRYLVDSSMGIVVCKKKQPAIEMLENCCKELDPELGYTPKLIELNNICKPTLIEQLENITKINRDVTNKRIDIMSLHDKPKRLITCLNPPRNVNFFKEHLIELFDIYHEVKFPKPNSTVRVKEITDELFDFELNGKGVKKGKFKINGVFSIETVAPIFKESGDEEYKFVLTFGLDIPKTRVFSNIKDLDPKIYIFTIYESEISSRYGTIIELEDSFGIWMSEHTNHVITRRIK